MPALARNYIDAAEGADDGLGGGVHRRLAFQPFADSGFSVHQSTIVPSLRTAFCVCNTSGA